MLLVKKAVPFQVYACNLTLLKLHFYLQLYKSAITLMCFYLLCHPHFPVSSYIKNMIFMDLLYFV
jgi:hypothetical protein